MHPAQTDRQTVSSSACKADRARSFAVIYPQHRHVTITKLQLKFAELAGRAAAGEAERWTEGAAAPPALRWRPLLAAGGTPMDRGVLCELILF